LWADNGGQNAGVPYLNTMMPFGGDGYPYVAYYFRKHFTFTNSPAGVSFDLQAYIDDGAVFYLNGTPIWSLRMPSPPIFNSTLATGYPCDGYATCIDASSVSGSLISNSLIKGDNVLAAEVHRDDPAAPDITFGLAVTANVPYSMNPALNVTPGNNAILLNWSSGGFTLQEANAINGPWINVPGPVISSPVTITNSSAALFFRLAK
jgi:hypothetical protein